MKRLTQTMAIAAWMAARSVAGAEASTNAPMQAPTATPGPAQVVQPAPAAESVTSDVAHLTVRNPFWPIGYAPKPSEEKAVEAAPQAEPEFAVTWPKIEVSGSMRKADGSFMALIEGVGWVEAGNVIRMEKDGLIYRWVVNQISQQGISCTKLDVTQRPRR